jgi:prepilin-type processing-associated H-X9-DG protein
VRHNGGAVYAFVDGHAKWFRGTGLAPGDVGSGLTAAAGPRDTTVAWVRCTTGQNTNPPAWFWPLSGSFNGVTLPYPTGTQNGSGQVSLTAPSVGVCP